MTKSFGWLKSDQDFENFKASKSYQTGFLKIRVHFSANQNLPRFGFIVPKKVLPKATDRNLIKRRLKNILAKLAPRLKSADILFFPRSQLLKRKVADVHKEVELIFSNARIWKS
jgi:ribonuclease P protein component